LVIYQPLPKKHQEKLHDRDELSHNNKRIIISYYLEHFYPVNIVAVIRRMEKATKLETNRMIRGRRPWKIDEE
jgi:hypothetical protein